MFHLCLSAITGISNITIYNISRQMWEILCIQCVHILKIFKRLKIHMAPFLLVRNNRYFKCSWNSGPGTELDFLSAASCFSIFTTVLFKTICNSTSQAKWRPKMIVFNKYGWWESQQQWVAFSLRFNKEAVSNKNVKSFSP